MFILHAARYITNTSNKKPQNEKHKNIQHINTERYGETLLENPTTTCSRISWPEIFLCPLVGLRILREECVQDVHAAITSWPQSSIHCQRLILSVFCWSPLDGEPLDFRTSKRNQYVIDVFGTPFRVSKANGQPVYRLSALNCDLTLFTSP